MDTQYKFRWILRDDDGVIEKVKIAFYEGIYSESTVDGQLEKLFLITKKLDKTKLKHLKSKKFARGKDDVETDVLYDQSDFGVISTDDELRTFLNGELAKDNSRSAIPEQRVN